MAVHWHWAFGNESPTALLDSGFTFTLVGSFAQSSTSPYTYDGAPTKWSMLCAGAGSRKMTLPGAASPGNIGAISIAIRYDADIWGNSNDLITIRSGDPTRNTSIYIRPVTTTKNISLYVDNVFKESTTAYDWGDWKYLTLKWDMSTSTWSGQIFVDGVAATSPQTDASVAIDDSTTIAIGGGSNGSNTYIGQIATWDNTSDDSEKPRFVTRFEANADGTDSGTWVPQGAGTDFAELNSPINSATYTEITGPIATNYVEVSTANGGTPTDLSDHLGVTPVNIDSICIHGYISGDSITAKTVIGDGVSTADGSVVEVTSTTTSYSFGTANTKPSGGNWAATDAPIGRIAVVSVPVP